MTAPVPDRPMCGSLIVYTVDGVPQDPLRCSRAADARHQGHLAFTKDGIVVTWGRVHVECKP